MSTRSLFAVLALGVALSGVALAQDLSNKIEYDQLRAHALQLWQDGKALEALPELQKLADQNPKDGPVLARLGYALISEAVVQTDENARKAIRISARKYLLARVPSPTTNRSRA